ncbi:exodeoxyribonuclease III [Nannocystis sp.]|uniref:exodeoxyribonuclease III n=1 Tax=Nannocystis sp. TaxID=1962667 RepID=UPI00344B7D75|nr:exodeoxyribonuclease III [Nannocystis sp.]
MRVASWNVNGLRACASKGHFLPWLQRSKADILGVQEVRARPEQLGPTVAQPRRWSTHFVAAERPGYSGVGLFSRRPPDLVETSLGLPHFDVEGRVQLAHFGALVVANIYFPNGNGLERDNSRVPYKLEFYRHLHARLAALQAAGKRVLVLGDFNTAHTEIDLARPKENAKTSGFLLEERAELSRWLASGYVDTFRKFHPGPGHYSWWSQRAGARERNVGWRIDYVLACPAAANFVRDAAIHPRILGSDHCPVSVTVDPAICRATAETPVPTPVSPRRGPQPAEKRLTSGAPSA